MTSERTALARLLSVCERMDAENQMKRPTELAYQRAIAGARRALKKPKDPCVGPEGRTCLLKS